MQLSLTAAYNSGPSRPWQLYKVLAIDLIFLMLAYEARECASGSISLECLWHGHDVYTATLCVSEIDISGKSTKADHSGTLSSYQLLNISHRQSLTLLLLNPVQSSEQILCSSLSLLKVKSGEILEALLIVRNPNTEMFIYSYLEVSSVLGIYFIRLQVLAV